MDQPELLIFFWSPKKGATAEMIKELDQGLENFAQIVLDELGMDIHNIAGAGAAGGLGAAFAGFFYMPVSSLESN
ncbi:hypothetical protein GCM10020331_095100 [Ectobacillus funiculus]